MKKRILFPILFLISRVTGADGQGILTLGECYEKAYAVSAMAGEKKSQSDLWQLRDKNLSVGWYPSLDASGSFVYNSSVVDMTEVMGSLPFPGITDYLKPLPHEQYKVTLDINQTVWDGGAIKGARALEKAGYRVKDKQVDADLYKLRDQVNSPYFNILLLDRQKELLHNYLELISKKISSLQSVVANGVALPTDLDVLIAEKIKLEQQINENDIRKAATLNVLSTLTGTPVEGTATLSIPALEGEQPSEINRPELQMYDLRKEQLEASLQVIQSKRKPKAFGFANLGYGNPPGSNFFKDEFAPFYVVGAGVKWNILDWNKARSEKRIVSLEQGILDGRKKDMTDNLQRVLEVKRAEIASLEALMKTDKELIDLRKKITLTAEAQYNNGALTATEYMNELNAERQAAINYEIHKINLAQARVEYLNICGKEIK